MTFGSKAWYGVLFILSVTITLINFIVPMSRKENVPFSVETERVKLVSTSYDNVGEKHTGV